MKVEFNFISGSTLTLDEVIVDGFFAKNLFEDDLFDEIEIFNDKNGAGIFINMQHVELIKTFSDDEVEKKTEKEQESDEQNSNPNRTGLFDWLLSFRS